jgi:conjugative transfer region protein (TIGR03748 family)
MRQWILILTLLVATQSVAAPDAVQVGRYLTVEPVPTAEQLHPLKVVIDVRFPRSVHTVGGAVQHLLPPSGYQLADTRNADRHVSILMSRPLPEVHRRIGPATLQDALAALAGEGWQLEVDPVHRLVSFRLHGPWRERYAARHLPSGRSRTSHSRSHPLHLPLPAGLTRRLPRVLPMTATARFGTGRPCWTSRSGIGPATTVPAGAWWRCCARTRMRFCASMAWRT